MTSRPISPAAPVRSQTRQTEMTARLAALARAEKMAATARAEADDALLISMHPTIRAEVMRDRALKADITAARLRQEVEHDRVNTAPVRQAVPAPDVVRDNLVNRAVSAANDRVISFHKLSRLAAANGAAFDVDAAIASGLSLEAARIKVTDLMADASEALTVHNRTAAHTAEVVNNADGWRTALINVAARQGKRLS